MIGGKKILPYLDEKAEGAADFYFGINATFRFIRDRLGVEALRRYWREMGMSYFDPVANLWREGGLDAVARYWREFFDAEPGAVVNVIKEDGCVTVEVSNCPAIHHLRAAGRSIMAEYCQHCYFVSDAIGEKSGIAVRIQGGNGNCRQRFQARAGAARQPLEQIASCV